MIDFLQKGGPLMWLLVGCSILSVAVFFDRLLFYYRARTDVKELLRGMASLVRNRRFDDARHECAIAPGPAARVIRAALDRTDASPAELRLIVQEAGQLEVPELERKLSILSLMAMVSPLLGLLGTVTGMLQVFTTLSSQSGFVTAADLSGGIYQCLLTTAAGLAVAICSHAAHSYLSSWVNSLLHDMERAGIEIVHLLTGQSAPTVGPGAATRP